MLAELLILLLRFYQRLISPLFGRVCRFEPSCSHYAIGCLQNHGALRGSYLTVRRLLRCHPFHPGGYDPPPPAPGSRRSPGLDGHTDAQDPATRPGARPSREAPSMPGPCNLDIGV